MSTETKGIKVRHNWLKFMYVCTIVVGGSVGLGQLLGFNLTGYPAQEPVWAGVGYSMTLAVAVLAVFGLRAPLRFSPVLLVEVIYKVIWFIVIFIPVSIAGQLPSYVINTAIVYAAFVVGDIVAIPFRYLFTKGQ
jgi:hypothetical protein